MKILVTVPLGEIFDSFFPPVVRTRLAELGEVEYNETETQFKQDELRARLCGKSAVITGWGTAKIDEAVLQGNDGLKIIAHTGGTVQSVADKAVYEKNIRVISGNDVYAESVAESVIAYALMALRKLPDYVNFMRSGGWDGIPVWEGLLEQTVGLIGFGMTARHLVKMLKMFRCKVFVCASHVTDDELRENNMTQASLDYIFSNCRIVSLHAAMNPENRHMIDRRLLERLSKDAILINTARGGLVDEASLAELLARERFRAVLDVFEHEPLSDDHPLRALPNAYLIPHRAGVTYDRRKNVTLALADDFENFIAGKPLKNEITKEYAKYMTQAH